MSEEHENDNARIVSNKEYNEILTRIAQQEAKILQLEQSIEEQRQQITDLETIILNLLNSMQS